VVLRAGKTRDLTSRPTSSWSTHFQLSKVPTAETGSHSLLFPNVRHSRMMIYSLFRRSRNFTFRHRQSYGTHRRSIKRAGQCQAFSPQYRSIVASLRYRICRGCARVRLRSQRFLRTRIFFFTTIRLRLFKPSANSCMLADHPPLRFVRPRNGVKERKWRERQMYV
jgi:hypothetical protein